MSGITRFSRGATDVLKTRILHRVGAYMSTQDIDRGYQPDKFEKWIIKTYSKKNYASVADVPDIVQSSEIDYVKSRARVHANVIFMVLVLVAAVVVVIGARRKRRDRLNEQHGLKDGDW